MEAFWERLHDAMVCACRSKEDVARALEVPVSEVERWLTMIEADLPGKYLLGLSAFLKCRTRWLGEGREPPQAVCGNPAIREVVQIVADLSPELRRAWLGLGTFLAAKGV